MKVIGFEVGRVVAMLTPEEWRSRSLSTPDAFKLIKERYGFANSPDLSRPWQEVQKTGFKFELGKLTDNDTTIPIDEFTLYNDGIVVSACTTEDAETFLKDIFMWAQQSAGIRDLTNVGRRLFVSRLIVEFEGPINQLINNFANFSQMLDKLMQTTYKVEIPMQLRTLAFHYDTLALPSWINTTYFSIDRRIGHRYEENRFLCEAPFRTADHIKALEELEKLVK